MIKGEVYIGNEMGWALDCETLSPVYFYREYSFMQRRAYFVTESVIPPHDITLLWIKITVFLIFPSLTGFDGRRTCGPSQRK